MGRRRLYSAFRLFDPAPYTAEDQLRMDDPGDTSLPGHPRFMHQKWTGHEDCESQKRQRPLA